MDRGERTWIVGWGACMGVGLLLLHNWVEALGNPAAKFDLIWPLYVVTISLPATMQLLSRYRARTVLWGMAAVFGGVMAGAAAYMGHLAYVADLSKLQFANQLFPMAVTIAACWFVLLSFAEHRLATTNWCNDYRFLFAAAWRNTAKLMSAGAFFGVFWLLLFLWAGLFKVLKIDFFFDLFTSRYFAYPVSAVAFGLGLSLYSAREEALAGMYRSSLNVLGWLLPLVAFISLLFLVALPFQGLEALWKTRHATALMLTLMSLAVFLFNAAWQDSESGLQFSKPLKAMIAGAFVAMPIYSVLCAYSLGLRIQQHGWSVDRIWAALAVLFIAIYAVGYAANGVWRQQVWMGGVKRVNVVAAWILVALLTLTMTPVLNPQRIAVNSQVERLLSGKVAVEAFDFNYLRFETGKYGNDALRELAAVKDHPNAPQLREGASVALKRQNRYGGKHGPAVSKEALLANLRVAPRGESLDEDFLVFLVNEINEGSGVFACIKKKGEACGVLKVDMDEDGQAEFVFFDQYSNKVFSKGSGKWMNVGYLAGTGNPRSLLDRDHIETAPGRWRNLWIGNDRFYLSEVHPRASDRSPR